MTIRRYVAMPPAMGLPDVPVKRHVTPPNPMQWGNSLTFEPPWQVNNPRNLLSLDKASSQWRVPKVQNLVLSLEGTSPSDQDMVLRWQVQFGTGGGNVTLLIDANGTQQFSFSAESLRIALVAQNWGPSWPIAFGSITRPVVGTAFFADGNTATDSATFTERFFVSAASPALTLLPPRGATAWRILGWPSSGHADSPFGAGIDYQILPNSNGVPLDVYEASYLENIRVASVPFPAAGGGILVSVPSVDVQGAIEWTIDL